METGLCLCACACALLCLAVPCGAVPCRALPCLVLRCLALRCLALPVVELRSWGRLPSPTIEEILLAHPSPTGKKVQVIKLYQLGIPCFVCAPGFPDSLSHSPVRLASMTTVLSGHGKSRQKQKQTSANCNGCRKARRSTYYFSHVVQHAWAHPHLVMQFFFLGVHYQNE